MAKYKALKGIVQSLAETFINISEVDFVRSIPLSIEHPLTHPEKTSGLMSLRMPKDSDSLEIDLLNKTVNPVSLQSAKLESIMEGGLKWFLSQLPKHGLKKEDINNIKIKVLIAVRDNVLMWQRQVKILAGGKEYTGQAGDSIDI